jgi:AraC-like DNA-binding protein
VRIARLPAMDAMPAWPPLLATRGRGGTSSPHAHHAMHVVLALEGELAIRVGKRSLRAPGVLTAPDVSHALDADGRDVLLVFIDPESDVGAALGGALAEPVRTFDDAARRALVAAEPMRVMQDAGVAWTREVVARLGGALPAARPALHPRIRRVLRHLRDAGADGDVSLAALAAIAELSPGRVMHAFTDSVGIPLRPYLMWLRLQRAAGEIVRGAALSAAAASAGFSDAAHMSRTFRRMLGMAPSMLQPARAT